MKLCELKRQVICLSPYALPVEQGQDNFNKHSHSVRGRMRETHGSNWFGAILKTHWHVLVRYIPRLSSILIPRKVSQSIDLHSPWLGPLGGPSFSIILGPITEVGIG